MSTSGSASSDSDKNADTRTCSATGTCDEPRKRGSVDVAAIPSRSRSSARRTPSSSDEENCADRCATMRCDRHESRRAKLYCQTCHVPICMACSSTRHRAMSGHDCSDIDDAVVECRARLARHAAELVDRHTRYVSVIEITNATIKSIRSKSDETESCVRRHFEEIRMRLEDDQQRILHELEMSRNAKVKELRTFSSELHEIAVKLEGRRQQIDQLSVSGTGVEVVEGCANKTLMLKLDVVPSVTELTAYVQPQFTKSTLLQEAKNLIGELSTKNETKKPRETEEAAIRRKSPSSWPCDNCTYVNEDKDIECQICAYAPWKQRLLCIQLPLSHCQTVKDVSVPTESSQPTWTCSRCTTINKYGVTKCDSCATPRSHAVSQPPAYGGCRPSVSHTQCIPELTVTEYYPPPSTMAGNCCRAPSPCKNTVDRGSAAFLVTEATQTETNGNPAQKMVSKIYQMVSNAKNRQLSNSMPSLTPNSRDQSPNSDRPKVPEMKWSADDSNTPWWVCSQCLCQNNMDKMECDQCGFEETDPTVTYYRH